MNLKLALSPRATTFDEPAPLDPNPLYAELRAQHRPTALDPHIAPPPDPGFARN